MKKSLFFIPAVAMLLLAGCGGNSTPSSDTSSATSSSTDVSSTSSTTTTSSGTTSDSSSTQRKYELSYETGTSELLLPEEYYAGEQVTLKTPTVLREDSSFIGWLYNDNEVTSPFTMPGNDVVISFNWKDSVKYVVKYHTGIPGQVIEDGEYVEGSQDFVLPTFSVTYKILDGWYYEEGFINKASDGALDVSKAASGNIINLYAKTTDTPISNTETWTYKDGVYAGVGVTGINSAKLTTGKYLSIDITLPVFSRAEGADRFGSTEIHFGSTTDIAKVAPTSGYKITFTGSTETEADTPTYVSPRSGVVQYFYWDTTAKAYKEIPGTPCRRYNPPLLGTTYQTGYETYLTSGETYTYNLKVFALADSSVVTLNDQVYRTVSNLVEGQYVGLCNASKGLSGDANVHSSFSNITVGNANEYEFNLSFDANGGIADTTLRKVGVGDQLGTLPTATKAGLEFVGWYYNDRRMTESSCMPYGDVTLVAHYEEAGKWHGEVATSIASGSGTELDPYLISNEPELAFMAQEVNKANDYASAYYKLNADLDLNNVDWTPVGALIATPFSGVLDGNNKSITNLVVKASANPGFIGVAHNATIKDLTINGKVELGLPSSGIFAGRSEGSTFINCTSMGSVVGTTDLGGITGFIAGGATALTTITNCTNRATVTGNNGTANCIIGGIAGDNNGAPAAISGCENYGAVTASGCFAAGIIALMRTVNGSSLDNCKNFADITSKANNVAVGGVVGCFRLTALSNCYCVNTAKINGVLVSTEKLYPSALNKDCGLSGGAICGQFSGGPSYPTVTNCGLCDGSGNPIA